MKKIYSKQLEEENNEYLSKLEFIVAYGSNPKKWRNTRKVIDIFNFLNVDDILKYLEEKCR